MYTGKLTFRSYSISKRSGSSIHVAQLTKLRSAGRSRVWAGGMRHGRSPFFILSVPRSTQVYRLLLLFANVRNDSYNGLIEVEVEVEFNGSDVGVSTASARRSVGRSVGGWVDESVAGSRGVRLAQVVYEERNRSSGRQHRIRITITFAIAVRRAHKQSETQPSQQDSHARTSRGQAGPLLFNDAIDVST